MKTINELLRNADPLECEPAWSADERRGIRQSVMSASGVVVQPARWSARFLVTTFSTIAILAIVATGALGEDSGPNGSASRAAPVGAGNLLLHLGL